MPFYTYPKTQAVYDQLHALFRQQTQASGQKVLITLKELIARLTHEELCEITDNGHSLLTDALFISASYRDDPKISLDRLVLKGWYTEIVRALCNAAKTNLSPAEQKRQLAFLMPSDKKGNSNLHKLAFWANHDRVSEYFTLAKKMITAGKIDNEAFINLLLDNPQGTSPLQKAICAGNKESINTYLNFIKEDMGDNPDKIKAYVNLLLKHKMRSKQDDEPCTPLFDACGRDERDDARNPMVGGAAVRTAKPGFVSHVSGALAYFDALVEAYHKRWMIKKDYVDLLTKRRKSGFLTPLQKVADTSYPEIIAAYFSALEKVVPPKELRTFLFGLDSQDLNAEGFTSLHDIVCHKNDKFLPIYFRFLKKVLTRDDFVLLLKQPTASFLATPLNKALGETNHMDNVNLYFDHIESFLSKEDYAQLLLTKHTRDGFSSLDRALSSRREDIVSRYFQSIKNARENQAISVRQYRSLLCNMSAEGYSTLMHALHSGTPRLVEIYFAEIEQALKDRCITKEDYAQLLCGCNKKNEITPFLQAVSSSNDGVISVYLTALQKALQNEWIKPEDYEKALTSSDRQGFSPIMSAISSRNEAIVKRCLHVLRESFDNKRISKEAYAKTLLQTNARGYSSFFDAFRTRNLAIFSAYCADVQRAFKEGVIDLSRLTYSQFLLGEQRKDTPLHAALKEGSSRNLDHYLRLVEQAFIEHAITKDDYRGLLFKASVINFKPLELALESSDPKNLEIFLETIAKAYTHHRVLDERDYSKLLCAASLDGGFTPLHDVCKSCKFENIRIYFDFVFKAFQDRHISSEDFNKLLFARTNRDNVTFLEMAREFCNRQNYEQLEVFLKERLKPEEWHQLTAQMSVDRKRPCDRAEPAFASAPPRAFFEESRRDGDRTDRQPRPVQPQIRLLKRRPEDERNGFEGIEQEQQEREEQIKRARLALETSKQELAQIEAEREAVERESAIARTEADRLRREAQAAWGLAAHEVQHAQHTQFRAASTAHSMHQQAHHMREEAMREHHAAFWTTNAARMNTAIALTEQHQAAQAIHHAQWLASNAQAASAHATVMIQNAEAFKAQALFRTLSAFRTEVKQEISDFLRGKRPDSSYRRPDGRKCRPDGTKGRLMTDLIIPIACLTPVSADEIYGIPGKDLEVNCWGVDFFPGFDEERIRAFKDLGSPSECRIFITAPKHTISLTDGPCCLYPSHNAQEWTFLQNGNCFISTRCGIEVQPYFPCHIVSEKEGELIDSIYQSGIHPHWPTAEASAPQEEMTSTGLTT